MITMHTLSSIDITTIFHGFVIEISDCRETTQTDYEETQRKSCYLLISGYGKQVSLF